MASDLVAYGAGWLSAGIAAGAAWLTQRRRPEINVHASASGVRIYVIAGRRPVVVENLGVRVIVRDYLKETIAAKVVSVSGATEAKLPVKLSDGEAVEGWIGRERFREVLKDDKDELTSDDARWSVFVTIPGSYYVTRRKRPVERAVRAAVHDATE